MMTTVERDAMQAFIRSLIQVETATLRAELAAAHAETEELRQQVATIPVARDGKDGAPGDRGERGETGERGPQGEPGQPGIPGARGEKGADGRDGRDGRDGIAILTDEIRGEITRAVAELGANLEASVAKHAQDLIAGLPVLRYRGVFQEGRTYVAGECATWGGSLWHCNENTTEKPGDGKAWTLAVKRGRDGRDAK